MADLNKLCLGCMKEKPEFTPECPYCKFDSDSENDENCLPLRTELESRYIVGKVLNINGEGITYIGYDVKQNVSVRIREYFPSGLCERINLLVKSFGKCETVFEQKKGEFLELARNLARMRGLSAILSVYDIFEANGTAYYISENVESIKLRDFLIRNGGSLSYEQLRPMFMPIMSTLSSLHAVDIIHRGISPDTLIIGKDGKIRLTEFCIADARTARSDLNAQLFKGYAAIEQYGFDGEQGPWTDVYGVAATMYRALVGSPPPEATARVTNDKMIVPAQVADSLSAYVMSGLANALQILPGDRTQSIETFRDEISASPSVTAKAARRESERMDNKESGREKPKKSGNKNYALISAGITAVVLIAVVLVVYFGLIKSPAKKDNTDNTDATEHTQQESYSAVILDPDAGTVPKLTGMTYAELMDSADAEIIKARTNYEIEVTGKEFSETDKGTIISQEPEAGATIKKGDKITLKVSLGSQKFAMPNIVGMSKNDAYIALLEAGFSKDNIKWGSKYSPTAEPDSVVEVTPSVGDTVTSDIYVKVIMNSYVPTTAAPTEAPTEADTEKPTDAE